MTKPEPGTETKTKTKTTVLEVDELQQLLGIKGWLGRRIASAAYKMLELEKVNRVHDKFHDSTGAEFSAHVLEDLVVQRAMKAQLQRFLFVIRQNINDVIQRSVEHTADFSQHLNADGHVFAHVCHGIGSDPRLLAKSRLVDLFIDHQLPKLVIRISHIVFLRISFALFADIIPYHILYHVSRQISTTFSNFQNNY